jgi:hypothetical protein
VSGVARPWLILAVLTLLTGLPGCLSDSKVRVASVDGTVVDAPVLPVAAYLTPDGNTAEVYLTDLAPEQLDPGTDLSRVSGRIVQLRLFLSPKAGHTPIESTACSTAVRHIVLADGAVGVYAGGGFLLPDEKPGGRELSGQVTDATLRLVAQAGGFADKLGPAVLSGSFSAPRNEALARKLAARVQDILTVVQPAGPKPPTAEGPGGNGGASPP